MRVRWYKTKNARLTQTVGWLPVSVALAVIAVTGVTGANHPTKMVSALLLTGGASAHVIICRDKRGYFGRLTQNRRRDQRLLHKRKQNNKHLETVNIHPNNSPYLLEYTGPAQTWSPCNISFCKLIRKKSLKQTNKKTLNLGRNTQY